MEVLSGKSASEFACLSAAVFKRTMNVQTWFDIVQAFFKTMLNGACCLKIRERCRLEMICSTGSSSHLPQLQLCLESRKVEANQDWSVRVLSILLLLNILGSVL